MDSSTRPQLPPVACPVCGTSVDPLRAREVVLLDDGFRYLCDEECRKRFRAGDKPHDRPCREEIVARRRDPTTGHFRTVEDVAPIAHESTALASDSPAPPWPALAVALAALTSGLASAIVPELAWINAATTVAAGILALRNSDRTRSETGWLAWAVGPVGLGLAAVASGFELAHGHADWLASVGLGVAAVVVVAREWVDRSANRPVDAKAAALQSHLPAKARVSVSSDTAHEAELEEVACATLRAGQEALVIEGETVPVDGVVRGGDAMALLHPTATVAVRRTLGDPLIAGARITSGLVRITANRVGPDRALARAVRFDAPDPTARPFGRQVAHWGGTVVGLGAVLGLTVTGGPDLSSHLAAAAAVLIAAPLRTILRVARLPAFAAATAAAERGLVFPTLQTFRIAGRVATAAVKARAVLTEGALGVTSIRSIDGSDAAELLPMVAGAEAAAADDPVARAIGRYAETQGTSPENVPRSVHLPGRGIVGIAPDGTALVIGSRQLLLEQGISVAIADAEAGRAEDLGHSVVFVGLGDRVRAVIALQDTPRPSARGAIQRLFDLAIEVVLLSGSDRKTAEVLARRLDLSNIRAGLSPDEQAAEIRNLRDGGGPVALIAQQGTDPAILRAADLPIVLDAAGGSFGVETLTIASDDVRDAAAALWIARAANRNGFRTLAIATGAGATLVVAASLGIIGPGVAALASLGIDAAVLPAGARLLRRINLRVPARG